MRPQTSSGLLPQISHPDTKKGNATQLSIYGESRAPLFNLGSRQNTFAGLNKDGVVLGLDKNLPVLTGEEENRLRYSAPDERSLILSK